ncbi:transposase [Bradyrhizobium sacchari]|uniref:transposase n=1 Tax=Bradyrhizobium sacchari TaxID=1399419 RepID=UPI0013747500
MEVWPLGNRDRYGRRRSPALCAIANGRRAFGLTPRRHQFGTSIDYEGRISKQGDVAVREALCEAAASLLLRVRKWSALRAWACGSPNGRACRARSPRRRASSPSILHRMWVSETDFHVGFGAKVTQRLRLKPAR